MRLVATLALAASLTLTVCAARAAACSIGPGWDASKETDLFVIGRITAVEVVRPPGDKTAGVIAFARVTMSVSYTLKGPAKAQLTIIDPGAGDGCSALQGDPTKYVGLYAALAVKSAANADGVVELHANRLFGAVFAQQADHEDIRGLVERHRLRLPATSTESPGYLAGLPLAGVGTLLLLMAWRRGLDRSSSRNRAR